MLRQSIFYAKVLEIAFRLSNGFTDKYVHDDTKAESPIYYFAFNPILLASPFVFYQKIPMNPLNNEKAITKKLYYKYNRNYFFNINFSKFKAI